DYFFSEVQSTSFYLSESLLFSTYWLLFLPLLNIQWKMAARRPVKGFLYAALVTAIHLLSYPALVWLISGCFYGHTFAYRQTFDYGLATYFIKTFLIYGLSVPAIALIRASSLALKVDDLPAGISGHKTVPVPREEPAESTCFPRSLLVPDTNNSKIRIQIADILYFSANSPYINVYHPVKKYLLTETLRALEIKLSPDQFVRIHKSCIVNVEKVVSCRSRLNGGYDLELCDGTQLRLSRNYTARFRARFHRHTPD
ncbi:MAG: LytTR family transcriptional regulator, partial [Leadbetterella sp.]|nr:LytTR family transcriptional regulator [Leadbetterella sp.]